VCFILASASSFSFLMDARRWSMSVRYLSLSALGIRISSERWI